MKLILCDTDEVTLCWHDSFQKWLNSKDNYQDIGPIGNNKSLEEWLDKDRLTIKELIIEFNLSDNFSDLKPYDHALEYIPQLYANGYKFISITACGSSSSIYNARRNNLEKYFPGMFIGLHCIDLGTSKKDILNLYRPAIWIEDSFTHALDGAQSGHRAFLFDYPYNEDFNHCLVSRVSGWQDIYKYTADESAYEGYLYL